MKFLKKILLALILIPCAFMFTGCLSTEPNVYLVDVVFDTVGDTTVCTYIYSNGYKKTKTIKNQGDISKAVTGISRLTPDSNIFVITYSDNSQTNITLDTDNTNSITNFEKKNGSSNIYIITYEDGTNDEIIIDASQIKSIVGITKTPGNNNNYTITYSDGTTSTLAIENDGINSVVNFEPKVGHKNVYIVTYEDGTSNEIVLSFDDSKTVVGITKTAGDNNSYTISYGDGSSSQIIIDGDNANSIVSFQAKPGVDFVYIITFEDGTTEEITIAGSNINIEDYYESKVIQTYNKIVNSAVIVTSSNSANEDTINVGSGFVYSMDKSTNGKTYIITNHHVVADENLESGIANEIHIFPHAATYGLTATYIGSSSTYDVAVIMVNTSDLLELNQYCYAPNIAEERVLGDTAIAVGNPNNQGMTITSGRVSLEPAYRLFEGDTNQRIVFGLDTPLNPGNSGGGIFNLDGEIIGIVEGGNPDLQNIAYAIPSEIVEAVAKNILYQHNTNPSNTQAKRIKLGIETTIINSRAEQNKNGITNTICDISISEISYSDLAYMKFNLRKDDILTEIIINEESYRITRLSDLDVYILNIRVGDTIKFKYTRNTTSYTSAAYTITTSDIATTIK